MKSPRPLRTVAVAALTLGLFGFTASSRAPGVRTDHPLDAAARREIVDWLEAELIETYVFLDRAEAMRDLLDRRLASGAYDELTSVDALAERLTSDLQSVSHDLHLRVRPAPGRAGGDSGSPGPRRRPPANHGFERVAMLDDDIGYIDLRGFLDAGVAGDTAHQAMAKLADASALIFDLRRNGGGSPSMIQLLSSYLFDEPVHLNSFYVRSTDQTQEFWTSAEVPGRKMVDVPVWVLTSNSTFSAAEEFTYNLKNLERATIVGETTGGGAHPVQLERNPTYPIVATVPFGRAVNPVTGTNWEGVGVAPDVEVPEEEALDRALGLARAAIGTSR